MFYCFPNQTRELATARSTSEIYGHQLLESPARNLPCPSARWRCTENLFSILKFNTLFPGLGLFQLFVLGFHGPGLRVRWVGIRSHMCLCECKSVHAFEPYSFGGFLPTRAKKKMATTKAVKMYVLATKHFATVNVPLFLFSPTSHAICRGPNSRPFINPACRLSV